MVQILPPATNLGADLGRSLGEGLNRGISRGSEIGFQRNMLQNALGGLNLPANATAFDLAKSLINATAGIPGAERYVGSLFPLLLQQMRGQAAGQGPGQAGLPNPGGQGTVQQEGGQFPERGGYLSPPMTQQEKLAYAERFGLGNPEDQARGLDIANKLSEGAQQNLIDFQNRGKALGVEEREIPYWTLIGQSKSEKNPEKLITESLNDLDEIRALRNSLVPGITKGLAQKGTGGFLGQWLAGGEERKDAIKRLRTPVQNLIKKGYEQIVRKELGDLDLGPTEIEQVIRPPNPITEKRINDFPSPSKNEDTRQKMLQDFFSKNVSGNSLLVLRDELIKKGYDWRDIAKAVETLRPNLALNPFQQAELPELTTNPPRDSLAGIFSQWTGLGQYIKGKK